MIYFLVIVVGDVNAFIHDCMKDCKAGYACKNKRSSCCPRHTIKCSTGTFSGAGSSSCTQCDVGTYSPVDGSST